MAQRSETLIFCLNTKSLMAVILSSRAQIYRQFNNIGTEINKNSSHGCPIPLSIGNAKLTSILRVSDS